MGINPSKASDFDMNKLTGTQKVMLASARIFGYTIGGNKPSGQKSMAKQYMHDKVLANFKNPVWDPTFDFHWITLEKEKERHKMMQDRRKMRIVMRGIKIGKKKGGEKASNVNIFETKK